MDNYPAILSAWHFSQDELATLLTSNPLHQSCKRRPKLSSLKFSGGPWAHQRLKTFYETADKLKGRPGFTGVNIVSHNPDTSLETNS